MKGLAVVVLILGVLGGGFAQSLRSYINASNHSVGKLMMAKDASGFKKFLQKGVTPDFKYEEGGKTMGFDEMCAGVTAGFGQMQKITRADSKIVSLQEKGGEAVAIVKHTMVSKSVGPDKKTHTMTFLGTSSDSYVKVGGRWKLSKMAWTNQSMMMDGKPMPPMK